MGWFMKDMEKAWEIAYSSTTHAMWAGDRTNLYLAIATALQQARAEALEEGVAEIAAERQRQREVEGWTAAHDDQHSGGEMALAATCYALNTHPAGDALSGLIEQLWPWDRQWWKPKDRLRDLERAGALIAAEIARIKRVRIEKD